MLEIYFDGVLLDNINYMELTQKWVMFDKEFKLGMTMSREFSLTIPKAVFDPNVQEVVIKYMTNDYAHLVLDSYKINESKGTPSVTLTLCDKLVNTNTGYDASGIIPCTLKEILQDICNKFGIELGTTSFANEDELISFYDSTVQARQYISYIAECAGGFARIEGDGKLYIRTFSNDTTNSIVPELCEQIIVGQRHEIERVVFDNGVLVFKTDYEDTEKETLYLNSENVYINTEEEFNNIVEKILGFVYYNIDTGSTYMLPTTFTGDVLKLTYENVDYYTIQQVDGCNFMGAWQGSYKLNIDSVKQQETQVNGLGVQVKAIKINQNRMDNILTIAVQDISTQKNVINNQLFNQIEANTTLIEQTATEISNSVTEITGQLQSDIDGVSDSLLEATNSLTGLIQANTTLIQQLATSVITTIKTTGGNNLLRNSVGYSDTDFWTATGNITTVQNDDMSLSGSAFILTGASSLSQTYNTQPGVNYSISGKIRHTAVGTSNQIKIEISGQNASSLVVLDTTETYDDWFTFSLPEPYVATVLNPTITISCSGDDILEITDLIIALGENQVWSGYSDEVYGKEHKLDKNGLRLSNLASNNSSKTTSTSVKIMQGDNVVAELSKDVVKSDTSVITNSSSIGRLQTVVLDENNVIEYV